MVPLVGIDSPSSISLTLLSTDSRRGKDLERP